jgi:hypothetical protein
MGLPTVEPVVTCSFAAANDESYEPKGEKDDGKNPQNMKRKASTGHDQHYE